MYTGKILFAQLMDFLPWTTFARTVERYGGDRYVKSLRCAEHFRVMAFAQLTYRESLGDIEACLSAQASKLYHALCQAGAFFVTRAKSNLDARRLYSAPTDRTTCIICDQTVALNGYYSQQHYPYHLRRIRFRDTDRAKTLVFLSNQFALPAATIRALYKARWQVELFFKWIKQHLRIKRFYGTSENAVKSQIWIAVSVYVLIAILKKHLDLDASLYTLLQILSVTLFEKMPLYQAVTTGGSEPGDDVQCNQLSLFAF